jgi:hypothetical protein
MTSWDVAGWCDVAAMTGAIDAHLRRHDTYHSAFDITADGTITRRTIDTPELIEFSPVVIGFMEQDQIREHVAGAVLHRDALAAALRLEARIERIDDAVAAMRGALQSSAKAG